MKGRLIIINWLIVLILILAFSLIIGMAVSAFYHPNSVLAPYYNIASQIWTMFTVVSLVLTIILSIMRNKLSVKEIYLAMAGVYTILLIISAIIMFRIEPVPSHFIQTVGETKYKVPREYTKIQNSESGFRIDICIETLTGIYERGRNNCDPQTILLSSEPIQTVASFELSSFIAENNYLKLDKNKLFVLPGENKYQLNVSKDIKSYTIATDSFNKYHLQINEQNELIRFVSCRQFKVSGNKGYHCVHWVNTPKGTLQYDLEKTADFDLASWQKTDTQILNLISQWRMIE